MLDPHALLGALRLLLDEERPERTLVVRRFEAVVPITDEWFEELMETKRAMLGDDFEERITAAAAECA